MFKFLQRKTTILRNLLLFTFLFLSPIGIFSQSFTVKSVPNPKTAISNSYISDPANLLSTADKNRLNRISTNLENISGAQVAIVMLPSIGEENPKEFSTALFNHWGVGQKYADNGLLILTVIDQRRTEFETGLGMEAILPDAICYRVGMQELVPHYKLGNYGKGLEAALIKFKEIIDNPEVVEEFRTNREIYGGGKDNAMQGIYWYFMINLILHLALIIWILLTLWNKEDLYDKYRSIRPLHHWVFMIPFPLPYILAYFLIGRLLKKLRNQKRFSTVTGNPMRKLSEEEEDDFLEKGQIVEEEIGVIDYDVWVDEEGDEILILKYATRYSKYENCRECNFKTYYLAHQEVLSHASYSRSGLKEIIHECKNCGFQNVTQRTIPRKTRSTGGGGFSGGGGGGGSFGGGFSGGGGAGVSW